MVIHHDKLAYGKLSDLSEELSDEMLLKMVAEINAQTEGLPDSDDEPAPQSAKKRD